MKKAPRAAAAFVLTACFAVGLTACSPIFPDGASFTSAHVTRAEWEEAFCFSDIYTESSFYVARMVANISTTTDGYRNGERYTLTVNREFTARVSHRISNVFGRTWQTGSLGAVSLDDEQPYTEVYSSTTVLDGVRSYTLYRRDANGVWQKEAGTENVGYELIRSTLTELGIPAYGDCVYSPSRGGYVRKDDRSGDGCVYKFYEGGDLRAVSRESDTLKGDMREKMRVSLIFYYYGGLGFGLPIDPLL